MLPCPQQVLPIVEHTEHAARGDNHVGFYTGITSSSPAGAGTSRLNDRVTTGTPATNCLGQSVLKCILTLF